MGFIGRRRKNMQNIISTVTPDSPAERAGIKVGDRLLKVDGEIIHDVLDYMYFAYDADAVFTIEHADGTQEDIKVHKEPGENAGVDFETYLMDNMRSCANNCIFCFVDQMPEGMRDSLYFKDDDVRLSFLTGSYITLTNMSEREIKRIIDLKISPINVSIHTMNPELRCKMLGNPYAGKGVEIVKRLGEAGIEMNCQIVCCPGINDGDELLYSMEELTKLYPSVNSVAIIPVGLTKFREGLAKITPFNEKTAGDVIDLVENFGEKCLDKYGSRIFFCSDELYLKANRDIHEDEYYEGYPQLENGVGLIRLLIAEFQDALDYADGEAKGTPFSLATGVSASVTLNRLLNMAKEKYPNIKGKVYAIVNDFFGHSIDVAGLITGKDLMAQLEGKDLGERLYITNRMLREGTNIFLDDVTTDEVSERLGVPVIPVGGSGDELLELMMS
jgi:putative radical SAM enzyme (TIGR03279 family)